MSDDTHQKLANLRDRIEQRLDALDLSPRAASLAATGMPDAIRDLHRPRRKRLPDGETLSQLARVLDTSVEWLLGDDRAQAIPHMISSEVRATAIADQRPGFNAAPQTPMMPLVGSALGGEYGELREHIELTELHVSEVLEWVKRDGALENDPNAYALTVIGESMTPLFEPGTTLKIGTRLPVVIGDNVIVQLLGDGADSERITMVLVKRLVKRTNEFVELQQYNPPCTFRVPTRQIAVDDRGRPRIHKVASAHF